MSGVVEKTTHADEIEDLQLEVFKASTNMTSLIESYVASVQELEAEIFDVREQRWLSYAEGVQLDAIGDIVDQTRQGRDDTEYRRAINMQILANKSDGNTEDLLDIFRVYTSAAMPTYQEFYNASIVFYGLTATADATEVNTFLQKAKSAGVNLQIVYDETGADAEFQFGSTTTPVTGSTTTGFAGATGTNGGHLLGVM